MPEYSFKCTECGKSNTKNFRMSEPKELKCECGTSMVRDFSGVSVSYNGAKNDPTSPRYWKNGKSNSQIADVIQGSKNPY